jgi:hypothetical protein
MALVTYTPLIAGTTPSPDDVYRYFYTWDGDSFEQINGRIEADNLNIEPDNKVDYTSLQRRATSHGGMVAGTANLDFFSGEGDLGRGFYKGIDTEDPPGETEPWPNNRWLPIPGGSIQFFLPYKSWVLLTWQVAWTNDSDRQSRWSRVRLFIDGVRNGNNLQQSKANILTGEIMENSGMERRVRRTMWENGPTGTSGPFLKDRNKSRHWCGHFFVEDGLSQGFHSASLRVLADDYVKQTRVRARNMKYIHFAHGNS